MSRKILINAVDREECRIARINDNQLEEFQIETSAREITNGNIYKGIIVRIEPGLQAVFVDYGAARHGFLQKHEIHSDYYQDNPTGGNSIKNMVKTGQELLIQITKDPVSKKGAMLSTFMSLPGRNVVLMPGSTTKGVSRKIEDENERNRLKDIVKSLKIPDGFGIIVRTAGVNCTKSILSKDIKYLMRLWKNIKKEGMVMQAPVLLYKERNASIRSIRDHFTPDINEILIDNEEVYKEIRDFIKVISPKHKKIIKLHTSQTPIFAKYQLEEQIASIFDCRVGLKSGGSIIINPTEALVAIDVNSGKATKKKSIEETAYQTNIEAAEEIARQLRLRDLGGLIVIDFIDMKVMGHKTAVEKTIKNNLKIDRARTKTGRISKFGLMEMSRQRINPSIDYGSFIKCSYCKGRGIVPSPETEALSFLRKLRAETMKENISCLKGMLPVSAASYLINRKRKELLDLESRCGLIITIEGNSSMIPGECKIDCIKS
ncbi:ribonuclease E [Candidatus Magnetomoraceae bacterium gMMP-15]